MSGELYGCWSQVVQVLLDFMADPNAAGPLQFAIHNDDAETAKLLIRYGAFIWIIRPD